MEKISEMIKRMCPEGVKKVKLKDVGYTYTGLSGKNKDDFKDGNALYVTYSNIFNNPSLNLQIEDKVQINDGEKQNEVLHGDILFTGSSETPEEAGMSSVVLEQPKGRLYLNSFCFGFRLNNMSETYPHYMRYILRDNKVRKFISKTAFGVTRFNINKERMLEVEIPLPPLPIQQEIVRILDSFTQLQSNLEVELVVRQKQYEFYQEKMLNFNEGECNWKKVSEFSKVLRGKRLTKNMLTDNNKYPVYHGGIEPIGYYTESNRPAYTVMIINVGASAGTVGYCEKEFWSSDGCFCLEKNEAFNDKYLYYCLKIRESNIMSKVRTAGIPTLDNSVIEKLSIPIPSLQRQQEIVSILDTFESLITNLKKEIEARKKQYEYYREQLLTFE